MPAPQAAKIASDTPADASREALLALCKASADALRLDVLRVLRGDSFGVLELCRILEARQSGMSHHLKILAGAGLITSRREGNSIFYRRNHQAEDVALDHFQSALFATLDSLPLEDGVQARLEAVQGERAGQSLRFFAEHADQFRLQQEQIAAYELYGNATATFLDTHYDGAHALAIEIGPGEGAFLAELSPRFAHVLGIDTSATLLEKARQYCATAGLTNVELLLGDTRQSTLRQHTADCVVANMVLHHVASPAEIFADAAALLRPGGQLFVTDLCSHDQSWVREACGDFWLGFEPEDLSRWAHAAGLTEGKSDYLAQRNGFRVQLRQFFKPL